MKRLILCALALLYAAAGFCQKAGKASDTAKNEWLQSFTAVKVDAPVDLVFIQVPETEPPKIVYDTHGWTESKFRFDVKNHVLRINERNDPKRTTDRTTVTVYYNTLEGVSVTDATAEFRNTITARIFDLEVNARASVVAAIEVQDLDLAVSGRNSRAELKGSVRYLTLNVSNGTVEAKDLQVMAAQANVTAGGSAFVDVTERLAVTTSTNGRMRYKSEPALLRHASRFLGGNIESFTQE